MENDGIVVETNHISQICVTLNYGEDSEKQLLNKSDKILSEKHMYSDCISENSSKDTGSEEICDHEIKDEESTDSFSGVYSNSNVEEELKTGRNINVNDGELTKDTVVDEVVLVQKISFENSATNKTMNLIENSCSGDMKCSDASDIITQSADILNSSPVSQKSEMKYTYINKEMDTNKINEFDSSSSVSNGKEIKSENFPLITEKNKEICLDIMQSDTKYSVQLCDDVSCEVERLEPTIKHTDNNEPCDNYMVTELMSNESINDLFDKIYDENFKKKEVQCERFEFSNCEYRNCHLVSADLENENSVLCNLDLKLNSESLQTATKSSLKRSREKEEQNGLPFKKPKKGITFNSVSVFYFPRTQGFTCIPSQGGSTLGMSWNHSHSRTFSLGEHAAEQRKAHRQYCSQQFPSNRNWNEMSNISSEDSDSDDIVSDSEMDFENCNFLQPIPTRERRAMLRAAGIHKIDSEEKDECRSIRLSREFCGCTCQIYCDPERCVCAQAGIKCQVDRMNFPCSCTRDGCANQHGRIEFNPVRVRTHYIHTLMRLEMEKKKEEEEQRNRLILNNLENSSQLSYSSSSSSSTVNTKNDNFVNFSYHSNLQPYYQQSVGYDSSTSASVANSCFSFSYVPNDQFVLPQASETSCYHQTNSSTNLRLTSVNCSSSMQYCTELPPSEEGKLVVSDYIDDSVEKQNDDSFIIRDLSNSLKCGSGDELYDSEAFIPLKSENFVQHLNEGDQSKNLNTSAEVSEETEKEESDTENFGDIIKKTMVESVIA